MKTLTTTALALALSATVANAQAADAPTEDVRTNADIGRDSPVSDMDGTADDAPGTGEDYGRAVDRASWNDSMTVDNLNAVRAANASKDSDVRNIRADDLEDAALFSVTASEFAALRDDPAALTEIDRGWARVGQIDDVILSPEGGVQGIVAEIGGVLGLGAQSVMVPAADISIRMDDGAQVFVVTQMTEAQLEAMPQMDD